MKGGRNQEGYADPTATIAVGRVAKEEREQVECEAADKRAYDLIKVLKYIIKGAGSVSYTHLTLPTIRLV